MKPESELSVAWTVDAAEVVMTHICSNAWLTAPRTGANAANVTAKTSVASL